MSRFGRTVLVICLAAVAVLGILTINRARWMQAEEGQPVVTTPTEPIEYEEGVYFFPATGEAYRTMLAAFLKDHADLSCKYFGADDKVIRWGNATHSRTTGHTVVCRPRSTYAQDEVLP